jgi:hypothetical protein
VVRFTIEVFSNLVKSTTATKVGFPSLFAISAIASPEFGLLIYRNSPDICR